MDWNLLDYRYEEMRNLADYIRHRRSDNHTPRLLFVCTHNSRRSQIARSIAPLIFHRLARRLDPQADSPYVQAYSGGSEVTRVHPNTVKALLRAGFELNEGNPSIEKNDSPGTDSEAPAREPDPVVSAEARASSVQNAGGMQGPGENPMYRLRDPEGHFLELFSKKLDHPMNPGSHFAAIMVCSSADEACPVVSGTDLRISLPFEDPGISDGQPGADASYDAAMQAIARDLYCIFNLALRP